MKILVTGATGFIGKYVVSQLLENPQIQVVATSVRAGVSCLPRSSNLQYISKDLRESEKDYFSFFDRPDALIHLAWGGLPNYNELFHIEENLSSDYFFIKNLIQNGLKDVSISGTCFEYGIQNGCLREDILTAPVNLYGLAKDTLRKFIESLHKRHEFHLKWLRLFYPYGPGQGKRSIFEQLKVALDRNEEVFNMSPGDQLRDYLPVELMAKYIVQIALQNDVTGVINCGSGKPRFVRSMVEGYLVEHNRKIRLNLGYYPYPDYEPMAFWGDTTKLNRIIKSEKSS